MSKRVSVTLDPEIAAITSKLAKDREITIGEALDHLARVGFTRIKALKTYADGQKPARKAKAKPARKAPQAKKKAKKPAKAKKKAKAAPVLSLVEPGDEVITETPEPQIQKAT